MLRKIPMMIVRPKTVPAETAHFPSGENSSKDQLLCRLEQQQTISREKIRRLENDQKKLEGFRQAFGIIYENSPVGYMSLDKRGRIYEINATAVRFLGQEKQRVQYMPLNVLVHQADLKKLLDHLHQCGTQPRVITSLRLRTRGGEYRSAELVSVPLNVVKDGQLYLTAVIDITERARQERTIAETKDFAEAIVETVRHPLAVLDTDLRIVSVNRAFTTFFKRPAEYIRGRVFEVMLNLWWSGNQLRQELEKVLVSNRPLENYRLDVHPPDIGRRILMVNARRLHQKPEMPQRLLVSLEDVTELETTREALRRTNQELEQRVAARTEALQRSYEQMESFCYSIAHDLRAPLRSMTGFSQLLEDQLGEHVGEQGKDYARRIRESAGRMDDLIRDLLSYGRLTTAPLETTSVDLEKVLEVVLLQQEEDIRGKHAKIQKKGRLPIVLGHNSICQAVLGNLISNAMKFVGSNVCPRVTIFSESRQAWERVWVSDNGIGIAPGDRKKIFGVFQRLHSVQAYPGTGIGLAIVARGIERMGGRMGLESELGRGSRFWFELPKTQSAAVEKPKN